MKVMFQRNGYSILNILGLSTSLAICLYIFLYVFNELSYDRFHKDAKDIYRISLTLKFNELNIFSPMVSPPLGAAMRDQLPEVTESVRLYGSDQKHAVRVGESVFTEQKFLYADSGFFSFFSFPLLSGNEKKVLSQPNSVVLTENLALKYFGTIDCVGKIILIDGESFSIQGITHNLPQQSHIVFEALMSMSNVPLASNPTWMGNRFYTYIKLVPQANARNVDRKLDSLVLKHIGPDLEHSLGISLQQFLQQENKIGYDLHPMTDTHLYSHFPRDLSASSDISNVSTFIVIGAVLLLMASFNFMNLSTAQFGAQVKSLSIRKTLGANRFHLSIRFLGKIFIVSILAACLSILFIYFCLPLANELSGKQFYFTDVLTIPSLVALVAMILCAVLIASIYPLSYLGRLKPVNILGGKKSSNPAGEKLQTTLVIFQQAVSIGVISFTLVIINQIDFIGRQSIGFDKNKIVTLRNINRLGSNAVSLKNALLAEHGIEAASFTDRTVFERMSGEALRIPNDSKSHILNFYVADDDQDQVMQFQLTAGRFFSRDIPSDSNAMVINQSAFHELGWSDLENKELAADGDYRYQVVGVIKDFNYESLHNSIKPLAIFFSSQPGSTLSIRYENVSPQEIIGKLKSLWQQYGNGEPFDYSFLDNDFDALFKAEDRMADLLTLFGLIIILTACLGLFSLSHFMAAKRAREIGIRKVMGATSNNIIILFVLRIFRLISISLMFIAVPYYIVSNRWLENFAYHESLDFWPLVLASLTVSALSITTIAYHAFISSITNPIKVLKEQ